MKTNASMTDEEFRYTFACKKILHEMEMIMVYVDEAKDAGLQGLSKGALQNVEGRIYDLKAAVYNALRTV